MMVCSFLSVRVACPSVGMAVYRVARDVLRLNETWPHTFDDHREANVLAFAKID